MPMERKYFGIFSLPSLKPVHCWLFLLCVWINFYVFDAVDNVSMKQEMVQLFDVMLVGL